MDKNDHENDHKKDHILLTCAGGQLLLPAVPMLDGADGGHLMVLPPRPVWDRTALTASELARWSALIASAATAMLEELPQLRGGCINYWDAGNWALNDAAAPLGRKTGEAFRKLHMHLLGRSPTAQDPAWRWGESPRFPDFSERMARVNQYQPLTAEECARIVQRTRSVLQGKYNLQERQENMVSP